MMESKLGDEVDDDKENRFDKHDEENQHGKYQRSHMTL